MAGARCGAAAVLCVALAAAVAGAAKLTRDQQMVSVLPSLVGHPGLRHLDLQFCGTGSEAQISRGPLGCGFPVVGDHPWLVALGFRARSGRVTYSCSGALVSDQFVVTSARCALGARGFQLASVRAREYDFGTASDCLWYAPDQCQRAVDVDTSDVIVHPKFKPHFKQGGPSLYDVALVRLAEPLTLGFGLSPICLPIFDMRAPPRSQRGLSFGLRSTAPLTDSGAACCNCTRERGAVSHVMDEVKLMNFNETYDGAEPCHYQLLGETAEQPARCVGSELACMADTGSPMVSADRFGGSFYLMGVATTVPSEKACRNQKGASVVYLPIPPHVQWLLNSMESMAGGSMFGFGL